MTVQTSPRSGLIPFALAGAVVAIVLGMRLVDGLSSGGPAGLEEPLLAAPPAADAPAPAASTPVVAAPGDVPVAPAPATSAELEGIRADIDFWAVRLEANPADIVAAVKLAEVRVAEARVTGDVTAYLRAEAAADAALAAQPAYLPAREARATILVALHRFDEARGLGVEILERDPASATALGVLGDASLELGDLDAARRAYALLTVGADGSAARVRTGRLAFLTGDPATAVAETRAAATAAADEGLEGDGLAFHHVTLGELLRATGDATGARSAYEAALVARPGHPAALVGMARLDAYAGDLDAAIRRLDAAIAALPSPEWLALRSDLLGLRGAPGDAEASAVDRATVEAVASLAGDAARVYDRGLSLYLSDHGLDPGRAVRLAADELAVRPDVYGHDALAWAMLAAGRADEAKGPMAAALAAGTCDARLWYHAGLVAAANGDTVAARTWLTDALALGPALDPVGRDRAAATLDALP
jgi:tetratricopeptide (TPR) repeat protein